jgi:hypothetical protein
MRRAQAHRSLPWSPRRLVGFDADHFRTRTRTRRRRAGRALVLAVALVLAGAGSARADGATVAVTAPSGAPDAVAGLARVVTVAGAVSAPARIFVRYRAAGGAPCAPSAAADAGTPLDGFYGEAVAGAFSLQDAIAWPLPGAVLFCTWLAGGDAGTPAPPIAQQVAFRAPVGSIAATLRPARPQRGHTATVTLTGTSEIPAQVLAKVRPSGPACAGTSAADPGAALAGGIAAAGAFSLRLKLSEPAAGRYAICLWLARSATDAAPIAGPRTVTFEVAPPPCVVPGVGSDRRPAVVRRRIRAAHCTVGRTRRAASATVRKGAVVRLGRRPRTRLAAGAHVDLVVSSGPARAC